MTQPSEKTFEHLKAELCEEIAATAYSVGVTTEIIERYAGLGYTGGIAIAMKQMVANVKASIAHFNHLTELEERRQAASQNRSAA
jgi:hypothetical protein